jgi:two-component system KDP operon response regulator KdpE
VLIALNETGLLPRLTNVLRPRNYLLDEADSHRSLQELVQSRAFDLIILQVKKNEFEHAIEACRQIRSSSQRSGIVLVSLGDANDSTGGDRRADGLEAGADDYITAPIESREFLARIQAVLRRIDPADSPGRLMRAGDLEIDIERRYFRRNGEPVHLTRREFDLLSIMMQKPGRSFTHAQLLRSVWGPDYGSELEYLRAYIRLLRKKIDVDPSRPSYIRTLPGVGYCFQSPTDF